MTINMTTKRRVVVENNDETDEDQNNASDCEQQDPDLDNFSLDSDSNFDENVETTTNSGWANSISQILKTNKPKGKKTLVLSKAKKLNEVLTKKEKTAPAGYQIETEDGKIKDEKIEVNNIEEIKPEPSRKRLKKKEISSLRVKPNILERDREKALSKIATKGVVQLFNSVRMQQKDIGKKLKEAGSLEVKKDKVFKEIDKRAFLDVLMGEKSQTIKNNVGTKDKVKNDGAWSVLRDDFMMGAKLKDWDKEMDEEKEEESEMEIEDN